MPTTESAEDTKAAPPDFAATLLTLAKGKTHADLSAQLAELVTAVTTTHKAGKLTLTLQVKPQKGVDGAVLVTAGVVTSKPRFETPASIFYATDEGALVRNDPNQQPLY
ncbi:hypothetical protein [Amycolatopsis sp. Poz14]|uniref:hypothetical protein n=1 Tax=Amycolatopsis sp. Poz14 TaxID=1447705 RepID=UPI001EE8D33B|nr:hypothetical protein [Amycolatopsis sp. Poz14]MCG3757387.1 hypothetical protein [Amycolatopsis sp. Poz14]